MSLFYLSVSPFGFLILDQLYYPYSKLFFRRLFISPPFVCLFVCFYHISWLLNIYLRFHIFYIAVFGVPFLQTGSSWFLLIIESVPCEGGWTNGLLRFSGSGSLCLCSGVWNWISSFWSATQCTIVSFWVSMGLAWLWAAHLLMFKVGAYFTRELLRCVLHWILLALGWSLVSV